MLKIIEPLRKRPLLQRGHKIGRVFFLTLILGIFIASFALASFSSLDEITFGPIYTESGRGKGLYEQSFNDNDIRFNFSYIHGNGLVSDFIVKREDKEIYI